MAFIGVIGDWSGQSMQCPASLIPDIGVANAGGTLAPKTSAITASNIRRCPTTLNLMATPG